MAANWDLGQRTAAENRATFIGGGGGAEGVGVAGNKGDDEVEKLIPLQL